MAEVIPLKLQPGAPGTGELREFAEGDTLPLASMPPEIPAALDNKVDKATDESLMLDAERTKLAGIQAGAQVNSVTSVAGRAGDVLLAKGDVGLGDVDNTSDANKPVSTAQQNALDAKAPLASPALTGTPTAPTATPGTNTTQIASTAFVQATLALVSFGFSLLKADPAQPAWTTTGSAVTTSQALTYMINGIAHNIAASVAVTLPALTAGSDYAIYATTDGRLLADLNWSAPAGEPAGTTRKLGGFHVALTGEISAYSLWDLNYRPSCPDPRGMVCINGMFWADIYLLGVNHHVDGTSRANVTIADGASPPKIPTIYNGNGSTAYPDLTWFVAQDVLQSHGKRCPSWAEFSMLAFGVSEGASVGADPVTTKHDAPRRSRWGIEQATGNLWVWGADNAGITGETAAASWQAITGGRGSVYVATVRAVRLGASWVDAGNSGSRSAVWNSSPSSSGSNIGVRGLSDHLTLLAER